MVKLKLLSAALFTAAVIVSPAMAQGYYTTAPYSAGEVYADPAPVGGPYAYGYGNNGYRCLPAPRVGQFASQPWDNDVPCEFGPGTMTY